MQFLIFGPFRHNAHKVQELIKVDRRISQTRVLNHEEDFVGDVSVLQLHHPEILEQFPLADNLIFTQSIKFFGDSVSLVLCHFWHADGAELGDELVDEIDVVNKLTILILVFLLFVVIPRGEVDEGGDWRFVELISVGVLRNFTIVAHSDQQLYFIIINGKGTTEIHGQTDLVKYWGGVEASHTEVVEREF